MATGARVLTNVSSGNGGLRQGLATAWQQGRRFPIVPGGILAVFVVVSVFADWMAPHAFTVSLPDKFTPPFWLAGGGSKFLLGTDSTGRDILSGLIFGARTAMIVTVVSLLMSGISGTTMGLLSGYFGGWVDIVVMRLADIMLGFPAIFIAMLMALVFGNSLTNLVIMIGVFGWAGFARMVRGEVLKCKTEPFVLYANVAGTSNAKILIRHIFPFVMNTVIVLLALRSGIAIMMEAALSFIGAGVPAGTASWGAMTTAGRDYIATAWWVSFFPGLTIGLVILSMNLLGDWVREALNPRRRQV